MNIENAIVLTWIHVYMCTVCGGGVNERVRVCVCIRHAVSIAVTHAIWNPCSTCYTFARIHNPFTRIHTHTHIDAELWSHMSCIYLDQNVYMIYTATWCAIYSMCVCVYMVHDLVCDLNDVCPVRHCDTRMH